MFQGMEEREQRRLMSDGSHNGEEVSVYRRCSKEESFCSRLSNSKTMRLCAMLLLIIGYFFAELIVGHITKSLTLVADSFHMLSDAISLVVALVAVRMSKRTAATPFRPWLSKVPYFNTFGWVRFEVLGALINATFLLALCISIVLEAVEKFISPAPVDDPKLVLAVGGGGLALNLFGLFMFGSHAHGHHQHGHNSKDCDDVSDIESSQRKFKDEDHLNMKAVFLHVLGDALGSVVVMISAAVLWQVPGSDSKQHWTLYLDPAMSLMLVFIMVCTTIPLFKQSSLILLQTVPKHIKLEHIRSKIMKIAGIQAIHDFHIWQLTGEKIVASLHVQCTDATMYLDIIQKVKVVLHNEDIHSFTVQPEFSFSDSEQLPFCQLVCGDASCIPKTCCPENSSNKQGKSVSSSVAVAEEHLNCQESDLMSASSQEPAVGFVKTDARQSKVI